MTEALQSGRTRVRQTKFQKTTPSYMNMLSHLWIGLLVIEAALKDGDQSAELVGRPNIGTRRRRVLVASSRSLPVEQLPTCVYTSCTPAPPQLATDAQPIQPPKMSINQPQLWFLPGCDVGSIFLGPHFIRPARLYIWFTVCQTYLENHIFYWKKVTRKRFECGNFWGVWSPAPPPTVQAHLGFCNQRSYGG